MTKAKTVEFKELVIKMENHWIHCFGKTFAVVNEGAKHPKSLPAYKVPES